MTFENIEDGGILFDKILKVLLKTFPTIYYTTCFLTISTFSN